VVNKKDVMWFVPVWFGYAQKVPFCWRRPQASEMVSPLTLAVPIANVWVPLRGTWVCEREALYLRVGRWLNNLPLFKN
jgi:hypothetical protein